MKILVRVLALLAAAEAVVLLVLLGDDGSGGANIGAGLLAFAVLFLAGFGGGLLDGRRDPARLVAARWATVTVVVAVVETLLIPVRDGSWRDGSYSRANLVSDLTAVAPFMAVLVGVGAGLGAVVGLAMRNAASPGNHPTA